MLFLLAWNWLKGKYCDALGHVIGPSADNFANEFPSSLTERKDEHFSACFCKDAWYDPCLNGRSNFSRLAIIRSTLFSVNQFELES